MVGCGTTERKKKRDIYSDGSIATLTEKNKSFGCWFSCRKSKITISRIYFVLHIFSLPTSGGKISHRQVRRKSFVVKPFNGVPSPLWQKGLSPKSDGETVWNTLRWKTWRDSLRVYISYPTISPFFSMKFVSNCFSIIFRWKFWWVGYVSYIIIIIIVPIKWYEWY